MDLFKARKDIVEYLYTFSANDYPSLCKQLALESGTVQEAFQSKRRFMYNRLNVLSEKEIIEVLHKIKENYNETLIPEEKFSYKLTDVTKRDIKTILMNGMEIDKVGLGLTSEMVSIKWCGCIDELEFLKRITDLSTIKVIDNRCKNFEEEFYRHRVLNDDFDNNYFFEDDRLPFKYANDELYLTIICEMFHPAVRDENSFWKEFVKKINELVNEDGFEIYISQKISGRDVYSWKRITYFDDDYIKPSTKIIEEIFDSKYINQQIEIMKKVTDSNPTLAIGKAKELLETCYKYISNKKSIGISKQDNLMQMDKKVRKSLGFDINEDNRNIPGVTMLCSGISNIIHGISEMRNNFGDGHGKDPETFNPLNPSYAKLVVYTSISYVNFLMSFL